MDKMKFNYQVVVLCEDNSRIIFAGVTTKLIHLLLNECIQKLDKSLIPSNFESVIYQPINSEQNGTQESTR